MAYEHMKRWSTSLVIRKTTNANHSEVPVYAHARMLKIFKKTMMNVDKDVE